MNIKELGYEKTPLGDLTLRRRVETLLGNREVFEVKLGDEYLMSSLFTEAEQQLATLGLAPLSGELDVVIGGLGLGYTAAEALKNELVSRLLVIDLFQPVIDWHTAGLVPNGDVLTSDSRCELRQGDFFALAQTGFDADDPKRKFDAVLLDIDHSPKHFLDASNVSFYTAEGFAAVRDQLKPTVPSPSGPTTPKAKILPHISDQYSAPPLPTTLSFQIHTRTQSLSTPSTSPKRIAPDDLSGHQRGLACGENRNIECLALTLTR